MKSSGTIGSDFCKAAKTLGVANKVIVLRRPSTTDIERYILDRTTFRNEEVEWMRSWIERDEELRELTDWFRQYYDTVREIDQRKLKKTVSAPKIIHLEPFLSKTKRNKGFVLAAQTPSVSRKTGLKTLKTFSSEAHKTLIRVLHDLDRSQFRLHVLSEFVGEDDIVMIDIPESNLSLISEKGGIFTIEDNQIDQDEIINWKNCKLHLPMARAELFHHQENGSLNVDTSGVDPDELDLNFHLRSEVIRVTANSKEGRLPEKMVLHCGGASSVISFRENVTEVPVNKLSETSSTIFFY